MFRFSKYVLDDLSSTLDYVPVLNTTITEYQIPELGLVVKFTQTSRQGPGGKTSLREHHCVEKNKLLTKAALN
jgi:hypothetical protein